LQQTKVNAQIKLANARLDREALQRFEMMRFNTMVQLRDCLMELLEVSNVENGVAQGAFLFETFRRLLGDDNTKMDLQSLSDIIPVTNK
jgi:hypothetical protein